MKKQQLIFAALFLFVFWLFFDVFFSSDKDVALMIKDFRVQKKDIASSVYGQGQIFAQQEILVKASSDAKLTSVLCAEGDKVKKEDLLITLENESIEQEKEIAHAKYKSLNDSYEKLKAGPSQTDKLKAENTRDKVKLIYLEAKKQYEDQKELFDKGFVSKKSLNSAKQAYNISKNDWEVAKEKFKENVSGTQEHDLSLAYAEAQQAKKMYQDLETKQENLNLKAPFDGTVIELMITAADVNSESKKAVIENQPLFTLADMSLMTVKGFIFESDVNKVQSGQSVLLLPPGTSEEIKGRLTFVSQKAKSVGAVNRFEVRIDIDGEHDFLKYGMNIDFKIIVSERKGVVSIPLEFLLSDAAGHYVFLKTKKGKLKKVYVEKGIDNKLYVEIVSGLRVGDTVCYKVENYN